MMIFAICGCAKNLLWVVLILALTFYIVGVGLTAAVVEHLNTIDKWNDKANAILIESFGTVDLSILSLFMAMSGGNDWSLYYDALGALPGYCRYMFLLFICFSMFAVVNIVTGIFVERSMEANMKDKDIVVQEELAAKKIYLQSMAELFEEMDEDGKGTISMKEFEKKLDDENVMAYFYAMELDVSDALTLFQLLDHDNSDEVGIDEFLEGCYKLQGESRSLDMKIMQYEVQYLQDRADAQCESLERIRHALAALPVGVVELLK
jgi:Ca2+-binding EF-hand superfamily protein